MTRKKIPIANIYYLLCYAWRHVEESDVVRRDELENLEAVHDLFGKVLAEGTVRLIRRGLDQGYREVREDLAGVRGKIALSETVKRALRPRGRVACLFEEMSHDVLHNRTLRSTLKSLLKIPNLHKDVRASARSVYMRLGDVTVIPINRRAFQQVRLDRNRRYYRFLLSLCQLIHERLLVDEKSGKARFTDFSEEKMDKLFEDFVIGFYQREQHRYQVNHKGRRITWMNAGTADDQLRYIPQMEADIILEEPNRRIIMDTKYYSNALGGRSGGKLHSNNLYQLLAYLRNREATAKPGAKHEGILLYPTVDEPLEVDVCLEGFSIRARTINLAQDWRGIQRDMQAVIA